MTLVLNIDGMMCEHCENRVKTVLEQVSGVKKAVADHNKKNAVITLDENVDKELLVKAVESQGYKVIL